MSTCRRVTGEATVVKRLKTPKIRCSNRPSPTGIQQNGLYCGVIHKFLDTRALTSSVTLQSEPTQLRMYIKRFASSYASPWTANGVFNDCMSRSSASLTGDQFFYIHFLS
ncbi:hypothetical protein CSKR_107765 [Clonorchis sinensis]|uniref:Uncharacterized protein n=1 Tax=Clonorchis sinensis TaxID=79923 RepID=A0A3R7GNX2_CLOSI|nr:hypothetical protein CSKR_107765 [Clonorchis sinensis]